jgi:hypothetical protein
MSQQKTKELRAQILGRPTSYDSDVRLSFTRGWAKLVLVVLLLGVLFWPGIQHHWEMTMDPYFVPFDAAMYTPAFFKFDPNDPVPTTYIKEYHLNAMCPLLYVWLLKMGSQFFDVRYFQFGVMYFAYAVFVCVLGRLGWVLGGAALCFAVVAFTLTARIFIGMGFIGGAARMFAYPLIALVLYALIRDRPKLLMVTVVVAGLLYPLVAIIGAFCLAAWMLMRPLSGRGVVSHWGLARRLGTLALTGFLSVAGVLPLLHGSTPYGRRVVDADIKMFPEAGPDGNYRPFDQLPYKLLGSEWISYYVGPMYGHGDPIVSWFNVHKNLDSLNLLVVIAGTGLIVFLVILGGLKLLAKEDSSGVGIRLIVFFAVCGALHVIAWIASPYLFIPTRYFMFSLPFLVTLIFPWSLQMLLERVSQLLASPRLRDAVFLGFIFVYLMAFGARGNVAYSASPLARASKPLLDEVAALPKDVLIAGWPAGELQKVEYVSRRNAFLTQDVHQVLHLTFLKTMRQRMDAVFDAYLSTDATPLYRMRNEFGVTHLLVEKQHFTDPQRPPSYFAPWRGRIQSRLAEIKGKEYLMNGSLHERAAIFNRQGLILLDLSKVP